MGGRATPSAPREIERSIEEPPWPRVETSSFIGREDALETLSTCFELTRLVTIFGPGGMGKTTLAKRYGGLRVRRGEATWLCDLSECRTREDLLRTVAAQLDVAQNHVAPGDNTAARIGYALATRGDALLILDNFDWLVEHAPPTVGAWLEAAPQASILVTSREVLDLDEEVRFELPPLAVEHGAELFQERARRLAPTIAHAEPERALVTEIVRRLEGIPLAIELAAARSSMLSLPEILTRLADPRALLRSGHKRRRAQHATLEAAIDMSWELLSPWQKEGLAQCAVFHGGFSLPAAEAVIDLSAFSGAPPVLDLLQSLHEKSLLRVLSASSGSARRFGFYEAIRDYAARKLEASTARRDVVLRHAHRYVEQGEAWALSPFRPGEEDPLRLLSAEAENLLAVARDPAQDGRLVARAALALDPLLAMRGPPGLHLGLLDEAASRLGAAAPELRVRLLLARADAKRAASSLEDSRGDLLEAIDLAEREGRVDLKAAALTSFGVNEVHIGRYDEGRRLLGEAADLSRSVGDRRSLARALGMLAGIGAPGAGEEALQLIQAVGDRRGEVALLFGVSSAKLAVNDIAQARREYQRLVDLAHEVSDRVSEALGRAGVGTCALCAGDLEEAAAQIEEALRLTRQAGNRHGSALTLPFSSILAYQAGRVAEARALAAEGLSVAVEGSIFWSEVMSRSLLGALEAEHNQRASAQACFDAARALARSVSSASGGFEILEGVLDLAKARRAAADGDLGAALEHRASARRRLAELEVSSRPFKFAGLIARPILERAIAADEASLGSAEPIGEEPPSGGGVDLVVTRDGRHIRRRRGSAIDLSTRKPLQRLLVHLTRHRLDEPGEVIPVAALIEVGWPGERLLPDAARNRLCNAIATLRSLGLKGALVTRAGGYLLDASVSVGWSESP